MENKLKNVTFQTFKELKSKDIVLPSNYLKVFQKYALENDVDLEDENSVLKDLSQDCDRLNLIVGETNDNLNSLIVSTDEAQVAIEKKDQKKLSKITDDLKKLQSKIKTLQQELFSDSLTKALNRRWLEDSYIMDDKMPENGTFVFLDLNKFKDINDTFGHIVGDQVLKYLVKFLKEKLKNDEVNIIRFAGDEFIIIFNERSSKKLNVDNVMENIKKEVETKRLKTARVNNIQFSFSYGIVNFSKNDLYDNILENADRLMYEKKENAR